MKCHFFKEIFLRDRIGDERPIFKVIFENFTGDGPIKPIFSSINGSINSYINGYI